MKQSVVRICGRNKIADIDERIYGSFIEHMGRAVYTGIYEPGHPDARPDGFRGDVAALVKELSVPIIRYPGGNFVSGYRWEDGVGPKESRPRRADPAWQAIETNEVGLGEFASWCASVGAEVMYAVNLGTRGIEEARDVVEYCNFPAGTYLSDLRRAHGAEAPYGIKTWCLGNEMDGPWQLGHKTADEYGRLADETAKVMKYLDPGIELVACGSSSRGMPTFGSWDRTVLTHCYDSVDYLSLHQYFNDGGAHADPQSYLAQARLMDRFIREVGAICDAVAAEKNAKKKMYLSFDEWNVWFHSAKQDERVEKWTCPRPILEDLYTFEDAILVTTALSTLIRNSDRVRIACLAQLVNVIAPILTEAGGKAIRQTIFWPFKFASRYGRGEALAAEVTCPDYTCEGYGAVPMLDVSAVRQKSGELFVMLANTSRRDGTEVSIHLDGKARSAACEALINPDPKAVNTFDRPDAVVPAPGEARVEGDKVTLVMPATSAAYLRVKYD